MHHEEVAHYNLNCGYGYGGCAVIVCEEEGLRRGTVSGVGLVKVGLCSNCLFAAPWSGDAIQGLLDLNDFHSFFIQFQVGGIFFVHAYSSWCLYHMMLVRFLFSFKEMLGIYYFFKTINFCFNLLLL